MGHRLFVPHRRGTFLRRPNRFVVIAESDGEELRVHCPNPGRLREILLPGRPLILEHSPAPGRSTSWTLAAAIYRNRVIPLISARSNSIAEHLVIPESYPEYRPDAEQKLGGSRIDWRLTGRDRSVWMEVKACTLVAAQRAMFPDAPSLRATKHLEELAALRAPSRGEVLFTVMNPDAVRFSANPHTDPGFAIALDETKHKGVAVRAVSLETDAEGYARIVDGNLPITMDAADLARRDEGAVIRTWEIPERAHGWRMSVDVHRKDLSRRLRRRADPPEHAELAVVRGIFPIRGPWDVFDGLHDELNAAAASPNWDDETDPALQEGFLNLLLDYRHRRVFSP